MRRVVLVLLFATGCYAELGAGYYPTIKQAVISPTYEETPIESSGWSASFRLGFYFGIPLGWVRSGIGVGWTPNGSGGDAVIPNGSAPDVTPSGQTWRLDLMLPFKPGGRDSIVNLHLTGIKSYTRKAKIRLTGEGEYEERDPVTGTTWLVGPTLSLGPPGAVAFITLGYQKTRSVVPSSDLSQREMNGLSTNASGFGIRIALAWIPTGALMKNYVPGAVDKPLPSSCYQGTERDASGTERTKEICP